MIVRISPIWRKLDSRRHPRPAVKLKFTGALPRTRGRLARLTIAGTGAGQQDDANPLLGARSPAGDARGPRRPPTAAAGGHRAASRGPIHHPATRPGIASPERAQIFPARDDRRSARPAPQTRSALRSSSSLTRARRHRPRPAESGGQMPHEERRFDSVESRGDFKNNGRRREENTEPHSPSTKATLATTGTLARRAMTSKPFRISMSCPVREMPPSGKMQTRSPACSALIATRMPSVGFAGLIGMTPLMRKTHAKTDAS